MNKAAQTLGHRALTDADIAAARKACPCRICGAIFDLDATGGTLDFRGSAECPTCRTAPSDALKRPDRFTAQDAIDLFPTLRGLVIPDSESPLHPGGFVQRASIGGSGAYNAALFIAGLLGYSSQKFSFERMAAYFDAAHRDAAIECFSRWMRKGYFDQPAPKNANEPLAADNSPSPSRQGFSVK